MSNGALATVSSDAPVAPARYRLLYSPLAWIAWIRAKGAELTRAHLEFNYASVAPHVPEGARVLDVGAWDNRVGALLRDRRSAEVLGVDVVDENRTDVPFRVFDGRRLPADDASFDRVLFLYVLHHSEDDAALLAEARRVLAPGGRVVVAEDAADTFGERAVTVGFHVWLLACTGMGWRGRFRSRQEWRAHFAAAGLELESTHELGRHLGKALWPENRVFVLRAAGS